MNDHEPEGFGRSTVLAVKEERPEARPGELESERACEGESRSLAEPPVTESNCIVVTRGGKELEVNG